MYTHNPGAFAVGNTVRIARKITEASNWSAKWNEVYMTPLLGLVGTIIKSEKESGFMVKPFGVDREPRVFWFPSCALELDVMPVEGTKVTFSDKNKKQKRVRIPKDGPWNNAPCPHLRWLLLGFFRDKLALVRTNNNGPDQIDIACSKCDAQMTIRAKA